ncbi:unnamed protein product [Rotaria magnacalcarata]|uniref:Integrase catalytic domain-containing protein n=1 Tax=Rotaria magnacalcarata TaxID=392030 RepID=A0A816PRD0_9BILA|nr:unnamed protein product [Rotaria magnacalcarata]CAF4766315.1 unnamed protein product [Rotaria magnacalcarata]
MLITAPLFLHYPIDGLPLILTADASSIAIGGVLQQEVEGTLRNLYYHSQIITPAERKYSTIEKEALAIYKCFERMRSLILGRSIIIMTDHCPLCCIMQKTIKNNRVNRITLLLQEYNIEKVIRIRGCYNCLPDYLSRYPLEQEDELFNIEYGLASKDSFSIPPLTSQDKVSDIPLTTDTAKSHIVATMTLRPRKRQPKLLDDSTGALHSHDDVATSDLTSKSNISASSKIPAHFSTNYFDITHLKTEQDKDPFIQRIISNLHCKSYRLSFLQEDNILYKLVSIDRYSERKRKVIYLPSSMITSLLRAAHDDPINGGHFSLARTYHKLKNHFWWPKVQNTIYKYIQSCRLCKQYNISRYKKYGHLHPISPPAGPFELIGIDFCGPLARTPRENQYVMILTDYFTRHVTTVALPNCTAETIAQSLFNDFFCKYGVPSVILSDRGTHFHNRLMENIQKLIGYNHIYSTAYHPQTNGVVERFNATFIPQIAKLQNAQANNWDEYLQAVVFAYNSGIHKVTQFSPYQLLFGRSPRLPIHAPSAHYTFTKPHDYFEQLKRTLHIFHETSRENILQQQQLAKVRYDRNRLNLHLKTGDKVLPMLRIPDHLLR